MRALTPLSFLALAGCVATGRPAPRPDLPIRLVSYNIRHGRGMDDSVRLDRTAATLRRLAPDLVGLQEVDELVSRSGKVDEAAALGTALGMHHAFASFMDYQGGRYGLAILSKYPIATTRTIQLPVGNEPRVALVAEVVVPTGDTVSVVNIHFDWVQNDGYRFSQALRLSAALDSLSRPWVLLGDFNDEPASRTLSVFRERAVEVAKAPDARLTFSSTQPVKEIDFVFVAPARRWTAGTARAIAELVASDHRPVLAEVTLRGR
jgi:endonuclease/exonuclease/phosphatase family metal-dependent hydrolase